MTSRFIDFRIRLFAAIEQALALDDHHKDAEGQIVVSFPGYFHAENAICLEIFAYVLGGHRVYSFNALSLDGCLDKAEEWLRECEDELIGRGLSEEEGSCE